MSGNDLRSLFQEVFKRVGYRIVFSYLFIFAAAFLEVLGLVAVFPLISLIFAGELPTYDDVAIAGISLDCDALETLSLSREHGGAGARERF